MKPIMLTQEAKDNALEIFKKLLDSASGESDLKINITTETLLQEQGIEKPIVYVSSVAYVKMMSLINNSSDELAWYGIAARVNKNYYIEDILVYPQSVTSTTVDADEEKCAKWFMELPDEVINNLKFQGHSHVGMSVTPSGRDTNNWQQFASILKDDEFMILCIGNKRGEFYWNIYDKAINVFFENKDITMVIVDAKGNAINTWAKESIEKYIVKQKFATAAHTTNDKTTTINGQSYETKPFKQYMAEIELRENDYNAMCNFIPVDLAADVDYDPDADNYFTYITNIPGFFYSSLYECYICSGVKFRTMYGPKKKSVGRPKKETKNK